MDAMTTARSIYIRPLDRDEWERFRDFRLGALKTERGLYSMSYEDAAARPESWWRDAICSKSTRSFGLFDGDQLIGMTSVFPWAEDASGASAVLTSSFIVPSYRGRNLSRMLYEARLAWIRQQPEFKRIVVAHRQSNAASRGAIRRHGFVQFQRKERIWPDGTTEDEIFYESTIEG